MTRVSGSMPRQPGSQHPNPLDANSVTRNGKGVTGPDPRDRRAGAHGNVDGIKPPEWWQ
jgi:hypothetical protein